MNWGQNLNLLISLGANASDAHPQRIATTWDDFKKWLYSLQRIQASLSTAEYATLKAFPSKSPEGQRIHADKDGQYIALADFGGHRRAYDTLLSSSGVPLDFDADWVTAEVIASTLAGFTYIAFTTYSHQQGAQRWRVFVPTERPMTADEHNATWHVLNGMFANSADGAAKDATRLSYVPGRTLVPEAARIFHADGKLFTPAQPVPAPPSALQAHSNGPVTGWAGPTDDAELITTACTMRKRPDERFGGPIHFNELWNGNEMWLGQQFPPSASEAGQAYSRTQADMALAGELVYWTGGDAERAARLMRQSGLARRGDDDWMDRKVPRTIERACQNAKQYAFMRAAAPAVHTEPQQSMHVTLNADGTVIPPPPPVPTQSTVVATATAAALANAMPGLNDYWAYLPEGNFIHRPSGEHHPGQVVETLLGKEARAAIVMSRQVHKMTWAPGQPERFQLKDIDVSDERGADCWLYNRYVPPRVPTKQGDVTPWLNLIKRIYPDDVDHIVHYMADAVQRPAEKCNHALVLGSSVHGIGKDTLLAPLNYAVGESNFYSIKPHDLMGDTNGWVATRILQVSESHDLGDGQKGVSRFDIYERCKDLCAAPPKTLLCNDKYIKKHKVLNVLRLILTTNHGVDGVFLPPEDRRHYCAWSDADKMTEDESADIWEWYKAGGLDYVAFYLANLDLTATDFNRTAPPPQTAWWHQLVEGGRSSEDARFVDAIDKLAKPEWVTTAQVAEAGGLELAGWINNPGNRRKVEREMDRAGYRRLPNHHEKRGRFMLEGKQVPIYRRSDVDAKMLLKLFGAIP
jgi:hypothetical protein